jgi:hypothetical protein
MTDIPVALHPLSSWQQRECLFCGDPATHEAFASGERGSSSVRCCEKPECVKRASDLAVDAVQRGNRKPTT